MTRLRHAHRVRRSAAALFAIAVACGGSDVGRVQPFESSDRALTQAFAAGSLIIPVDTTYQDNDTLTAFGLVYALLSGGVQVYWVALTGKTSNTAVDFTASARDFRTNATITNFGYRGGPFIVDSAYAAQANPIITNWQNILGFTTNVHIATASFSADVRRTLTAAPRIAVFADNYEQLAFNYLNGAGIPDSTGAAWSGTSPGVLNAATITGGALVRADGTAAYCQLTSMHYDLATGAPAIATQNQVVSHVRTWLTGRPVHAFMECQAVPTFENNINGHYLTTNGIANAAPGGPPPVNVLVPDSLFAQFDAVFQNVTGLFQSANLAGGSAYKASSSVLINSQGAPATGQVIDVTGYLDGSASNGKVTYLGGHDYSQSGGAAALPPIPISTNPPTNGVRLFLDSLFESACAAAEGAPVLSFTKSAPAATNASSVTFTLSWSNTGAGSADSAVITDVLAAGLTFSSATGGGTAAGQTVTWSLGNIAAGASGSVSVTASVAVDGTYSNQAQLAYKIGQTSKTLASNTTSTVRDTVVPVVTITAKPANPTNQTTANFSFSSSKAGSTFSCKLDSGAAAACTSPTSYTGLAAGSHTFTVTGTDPAGNVSAPVSYTWTIDLTVPVASITAPTPTNPTDLTTASFTFTSTKAGTFSCKLDAAAAAACTSPTSYSGLSAASHTFTVIATDTAGNASAPVSFTWTIDLTPPVASITASPANPTNQTTASLSFSSNKPGSTFSCKLDSGAAAACTSPTSYTGLAAGSHTFTVTATDPAGNASTPVSATWTIDLTPPVASITASPANPTNQTTASFSFSSSKPGSTFSCKLDSGAAAACTSPTSYSGLSAASHTFTVTATDTAGNVSAPVSFTWTVTVNPPVASITSTPANPSNQTMASFSFTSSKPGSTFSCKLDSGAAAACTSPTSYTGLGAGSHTFTVTATDTVGNVSAPVSYTWTIDLTSPVASITASPANPTNQTTAYLSFSSNKAGSTFSCKLDAGAAAACTSPNSYSALGAGSHTFTVTATDIAGNASAPTSFTWLVD